MENRFGYIYVILFLDPLSHLYKHYYIGQHKYIEGESLFDPNGKNYYHGSSARATKEYWPYYSLHKKSILCWCDNEIELRNKEDYYIQKHINKPNCINCCISNKINTSTYINNDFKERVSNSVKQYYIEHPEAKKNLSESHKGQVPWMKGKHHTEESKKKLSESLKGRITWNKGIPNSEETRRKMSESLKGRISPNKGKKFSEEWCKHISDGHKGQIPWMKGKHHTEESKKKLSESHKGKTPWIKGKHKVYDNLEKTIYHYE